MAQLLKGTAFITGAASGIGQACAVAFARYGITKLALADVNFEALQASNADLRKQFPKVEILDLHVDVRRAAEVKRGIQETVERFGRLDVALNNAGLGGSGKQTHEVDEEEWDRVIDVDLNGVRRCQKEEIAVMLKQENLSPREGRGRIINVASMYGLVGPAGMMHHTAYTTAKHGVLGLTKADANSYGGEHGIRINAICPGYVDTPLVRAAMDMGSDSPLAHDIKKTPLERMAAMEEIADSVVFLASPMSSFMQGAALVADGGFTTN
ncbi:enoyl-(Acyl carrier protein) reductase domain-containing protein [Sarocladium implicatum]|nr:enoyl-(Acyl carrier protein) reductase domain-containing protein [Sarocladium implicatum]